MGILDAPGIGEYKWTKKEVDELSKQYEEAIKKVQSDERGLDVDPYVGEEFGILKHKTYHMTYGGKLLSMHVTAQMMIQLLEDFKE